MADDGTELLRTFVALAVSPEQRTALARVQARLRRLPCRIGWVRPEQLHLTLAFLGERPAAELAAVPELLRRLAAPLRPFPWRLRDLGYFGSPRHPRVIWAGVADGARELGAWQEQLAAALALAGLALEARPFTPHLTLGRVRAAAHADLIAPALAPFADADLGKAVAAEFSLMRSRLTDHGPCYDCLCTAPCGRPA
ncbi:MAG: RNA 2',3'-cyclic phosphodiesterase [Lentisphaeria bacterium]